MLRLSEFLVERLSDFLNYKYVHRKLYWHKYYLQFRITGFDKLQAKNNFNWVKIQIQWHDKLRYILSFWCCWWKKFGYFRKWWTKRHFHLHLKISPESNLLPSFNINSYKPIIPRLRELDCVINWLGYWMWRLTLQLIQFNNYWKTNLTQIQN